jgi:hypothetical protein
MVSPESVAQELRAGSLFARGFSLSVEDMLKHGLQPALSCANKIIDLKQI